MAEQNIRPRNFTDTATDSDLQNADNYLWLDTANKAKKMEITRLAVVGDTVATEADLVAGSTLPIMTANGPKALPGNAIAKSSEQAALTTYAQNVAHSIAPEFDPTRTNENPYKAGETVTYTDGKAYVFNVDHYGPWASADVMGKDICSIIQDSGIVQRLAGGVLLEQGSFVNGVKTVNAKRVRFDVPLIPPFAIKVKTGYKILSYHRLNTSGAYVDYSTVNASSFDVSEDDGHKYAVIITKTDSTQDISPTEDIIDEFNYGLTGLDFMTDFKPYINSLIYKEFDSTRNYDIGEKCGYDGTLYLFTGSKNAGNWNSSVVVRKNFIDLVFESGYLQRINGGVTLEQGSYLNGIKSDNATRVRLSVPLIAPFSISVKPGYLIRSFQRINADGVVDSFGTVSTQTYSVDTSDSFRYCINICKEDNTQTILPTEDIIAEFDYGLSSISKKDVVMNSNSAKIFERVGVIGDSYAAGYIKNDSQDRVIATNYSWPCFMQGKTARTWTNYAKSGSTCKSWVNKVDNFSNLDLIESEGEKCQAYVIGLMINDSSSVNPYYTPVGVASDIGTDNDTYYAYLYKLIQCVVDVNSDAKIFVCTLPKSGYSTYNQAVRDVVAYCKETLAQNVYCIDLYESRHLFNDNAAFVQDAINGHYTAIGYEYMAEVLYKLISNIIDDNVSEFQNVCRIPFDAV